ncbi:MAG: proline racemase family protein, partial [Candidatus Poribacteria bacterium]
GLRRAPSSRAAGRTSSCRAGLPEQRHPDNPEIRSIQNVGFTGPVERTADGIVSRNAMIVGHGRLDRSPAGTGTAARLDLLHATGEIATDETF